jgi:hypothetical protein
MPVEVQCACGSRLKVPRKLVGKGVVVCPKCGASILAEAREAAVESICDDSLRNLAAKGVEAASLPLATAPPPPLDGAARRPRVEIDWSRLVFALLLLALVGGGAVVGWRAMHHVVDEVSDDLTTNPAPAEPVSSGPSQAETIARQRQANIKRQAVEAERKRRNQRPVQ